MEQVETKVDVLAVMARDAVQAVQYRVIRGENSFALATESDDARAAIAELIEAARHWNRWDYEVMSARVNGESVYSFNELAAMREFARGLTDSALARVGGGK